MRQTAPDSAGPSRHEFARLTAAPTGLPTMGLPAMGHAAICLPAAHLTAGALPSAPVRQPAPGSTPHPLEPLAARAAWLLKGCEVSLIPGADGPAMLMIERMGPDGRTATHTWLLTPASPTRLELETIVGETRLDLVAEGPPNRLLAWLWRLNLRAARAAARQRG